MAMADSATGAGTHQKLFFCFLSFHVCLLALRYKSLLCLRDLPPADGENCVKMLHKLGPVKPGSYQLGVSKVSALSDTHRSTTRPHIKTFHLCLSDFPERGAVSAVGGETRPFAEFCCHDAAEIQPHVFSPEEL